MSVNNPMAPVAKAPRWPIVSVLNWLFVLVGWIELVSAIVSRSQPAFLPILIDVWNWCVDVAARLFES